MQEIILYFRDFGLYRHEILFGDNKKPGALQSEMKKIIPYFTLIIKKILCDYISNSEYI